MGKRTYEGILDYSHTHRIPSVAEVSDKLDPDLISAWPPAHLAPVERERGDRFVFEKEL